MLLKVTGVTRRNQLIRDQGLLSTVKTSAQCYLIKLCTYTHKHADIYRRIKPPLGTRQIAQKYSVCLTSTMMSALNASTAKNKYTKHIYH